LTGELTSGIVLGLAFRNFPQFFPVLSSLPDNEIFIAITDLGIFFVMLMAGLELRTGALARASRRAIFVAIGGMVVPLAAGFFLGWVFLPGSDYRLQQMLFLGVAMSITAVPVSVKVLMDLDRLKTDIGRVIVSAAVVDDVLSLMLLALLTAVLDTGSLPALSGLLILAGKILLFFVVTYLIGRHLLPRIGPYVRRFRSTEFEFSALLLVALGFSVLAELFDMHFILGAFMAGLFFERDTVDHEIYDQVNARVKAIGEGFLGPVFFASIGLHLDIAAIHLVPAFVVAVIVVASVSKLVGCSIPAMSSGMGSRAALTVGIGMNSRGAVELVIADIALRAGLFSAPSPPPPEVDQLFSVIVIMAIVTTLVTPLVLRRLLRGSGDHAAPDAGTDSRRE
jgi:Kef-type K+ transport system membrane component KefB